MAGADGQEADPLIDRLTSEPYAFDFYQAVRLLQMKFSAYPRIGTSWSPAKDPVRFAQNPFLEFAPSTLEAVQWTDRSKPPVVFTRHFGLFGPNGPLPLCLTDYARKRILHHGDRTFTAFCNIFHHRLLSFFFRAWADARKTVDQDRPKEQRWSYYVGSLCGLGMDSLLERDAIPDQAKLYHVSRLMQQTRNAEGLETIIQDFFSIKTQIITFMGRWMTIPSDSRWQLGGTSGNGTLGSTAIVGSRIWTCQLNFRIRMGPMKLPELESLLPNRDSFKRLRDWVRLYAGEEYFWDVQLVLARDQVPEIRLGKSGRLGWTTWLKAKEFDHDVEDLVVEG